MLLPGILVAALVVGILQAGLPEAMVKTNNEAPSQKTATKEKAKKKKRSAAAAAMKSGGGEGRRAIGWRWFSSRWKFRWSKI